MQHTLLHILPPQTHLLVFLHPPQEDQHPITPPAGLIPRFVHACMLLLALAEGVGHKALGCHGGLPLVAPGQADATDVQLAFLSCSKCQCVVQLCYTGIL